MNINYNKITPLLNRQLVEELIMEMGESKSITTKFYAKELYKNLDNEYNLIPMLYNLYKKISIPGICEDLTDIDNKINTLEKEFKANYYIEIQNKNSLQFLGNAGIRGNHVQEKENFDGYPTKYQYTISYYPETGFIGEDNSRGNTKEYCIKSTDNEILQRVPQDTRRDCIFTTQEFIQENKLVLEQLDTIMKEKIKLITEYTDPKHPMYNRIYSILNEIFKDYVKGCKPSYGFIINDNGNTLFFDKSYCCEINQDNVIIKDEEDNVVYDTTTDCLKEIMYCNENYDEINSLEREFSYRKSLVK